MAGVPERSFPMVEAEPTPLPEPVAPPNLSAVGAGLSQVGEELYGVGMVAYRNAVEAQAQDKETEFQKKALEISDKYSSLYNFDAVQAHQKTSASLEQLRAEVGQSIGTMDGRRLYMNNSLRTLRLIQENVNRHFASQSRSYQLTTYRHGQDVDTQAVAALAKGGDLEGASKKIEDMQARAEGFASSHGLDPELEAKLASAKGAHALVHTMLDARSPLSSAALERWGDHLDPSYQAAAQKTIEAQSVVSDGEKILANLPRVDADKKTNVRGSIDDDEYRAALNALPGDAHGGAVRKYVEDAKKRLDADFTANGQQMEERIRRLGQGRGPGGQFGVPEDSQEWQEFSALYPGRRDKLLTEAHAKLRRALSEGRQDEAHANREAFGRTAAWLREASPEEIHSITPGTVADRVRADGGTDVSRAQELLAKLQKDPPDATGRRIPTTAREVLNTVNPKFARVNQWQAVEYLEGLHKQHPDWTPTQLGKDLSDHIVKGWFGSRSLNLPKVAPPAVKPKAGPVRIKGDDDYNALKPGTHYVGPDGVERVK